MPRELLSALDLYRRRTKRYLATQMVTDGPSVSYLIAWVPAESVQCMEMNMGLPCVCVCQQKPHGLTTLQPIPTQGSRAEVNETRSSRAWKMSLAPEHGVCLRELARRREHTGQFRDHRTFIEIAAQSTMRDRR